MSMFEAAGPRSGARRSRAFSTVISFGAGLARRWREHRALALIEGLPEGLMKDVGYPAAGNDRPGRDANGKAR